MQFTCFYVFSGFLLPQLHITHSLQSESTTEYIIRIAESRMILMLSSMWDCTVPVLQSYNRVQRAICGIEIWVQCAISGIEIRNFGTTVLFYGIVSIEGVGNVYD